MIFSLAAAGCSSGGFLYRDGWMFSRPGNIRSHVPARRSNIVETAKQYLGTDYLYGGVTPKGFDCSGFVMYVYRQNRITVPRSTRDQFEAGTRVALRRARPGDLVFFQTSRKGISHVGIYLGNYRFIHAPSTGKTVSIAEIKNPYWHKRFRGAVTFL
jgi:peptidoglycan endopeptidase LytE